MEDFQKLAQSETQGNIVTEFWHFLGQTKKWWLMPILIVVFAFALLVFFSGTAAAPFIYTLFQVGLARALLLAAATGWVVVSGRSIR